MDVSPVQPFFPKIDITAFHPGWKQAVIVSGKTGSRLHFSASRLTDKYREEQTCQDTT
jgi:hypothetical protein